MGVTGISYCRGTGIILLSIYYLFHWLKLLLKERLEAFQKSVVVNTGLQNLGKEMMRVTQMSWHHEIGIILLSIYYVFHWLEYTPERGKIF